MREEWIDVSKSILIYLMVLGHCMAGNGVNTWFYAFHMPAFFIISGYLYKSHPITRTIKQLFIPVLFFSAINLVYKLCMNILTQKGIENFLNLLTKCWQPYIYTNDGNYTSLFPGVWFIIVLFFCRMLMGDLKIFSINPKFDLYLALLCITVVVIFTFIPSYDKILNIYIVKTIVCLPFMLLGRLFKQFKNCLKKKFYLLIPLLTLYVLLTYFNGPIDIYSSQFGKSVVIMYMNAFLASVAFFMLCFHLKIFKSSFELLSKGTLLILGLHQIILSVGKILIYKAGIEESILASLLLSFVVLLVCMPLIKFSINRYPWIIGK